MRFPSPGNFTVPGVVYTDSTVLYYRAALIEMYAELTISRLSTLTDSGSFRQTSYKYSSKSCDFRKTNRICQRRSRAPKKCGLNSSRLFYLFYIICPQRSPGSSCKCNSLHNRRSLNHILSLHYKRLLRRAYFKTFFSL